MAVLSKDLWSLVRGTPQVDPTDLAAAIEDFLAHDPQPDYRSRLLIRDSIVALRGYWGEERLSNWLYRCSERRRIEAICTEEFERPGFPSLSRRLMDKTSPEDIKEFLRELGVNLQRTLQVRVAGSAAVILPGLLSRRTDDINIVNEVPAELRGQHRLLARLKTRYGLELGHVQSHYLPSGWEQRVHSIEPLGRLQVYLADPYDVFVSKLFSGRDKDLDDLRMLKRELDMDTIVRHLRENGSGLLADPFLLPHAKKNWYILFGEDLPS